MSTVNIILSTYNGEKYLRELIDSIIGQTFDDWSLYICDDGSKDDTLRIAEEYASKFSDRIFLKCNSKNYGSTYSFLSNLYLIFSSHDALLDEHHKDSYYMFCDQDDVWLKDKIAVTLDAVKALERRYGHDNPAMAFTDAVLVDEKLGFINNSFYKTNRLATDHLKLNRMLMENKCIGCTMMFNHALVRILRFPAKGVRYHDWWLALVASAFGRIRYIDTPTILYRQTGSNQVGQTAFSDYVGERLTKASSVKIRLSETIGQGKEFLSVYSDILSVHNKMLLSKFSSLSDSGFLHRRFSIIRYGFFKSGFIRNVGLLILI